MQKKKERILEFEFRCSVVDSTKSDAMFSVVTMSLFPTQCSFFHKSNMMRQHAATPYGAHNAYTCTEPAPPVSAMPLI